MNKKIPANELNELRREMASVISEFKAYDVPGVCERLGLLNGTEEEAYKSKFSYASRRLARLKAPELMKVADQLCDETAASNLLEVIKNIRDLNNPEITKLTRRRLLKQFEEEPFTTEVEDFEFIQAVWPIAQLSAPGENDNRTLEEYLIQHTIRNYDLTQQDVLASLGLLDCSTSQLFHFLEQITSAEFQSDERQQILAGRIDKLLRHDGYTLAVNGYLSGSPVYKVKMLPKGSPSDRNISLTLSEFDPEQISVRWEAALQNRTKDPERAITLARTLLEDVCKWILDDADESWEETDDLPSLYKRLSKTLNLAPDDHTEQIFKQILGSCQSVVTALGALRNKLGDAHSIGPKRVKPAARHAELAVNLAGTMSTFLVSTWSANKTKMGE